jgi:hypothetical protein
MPAKYPLSEVCRAAATPRGLKLGQKRCLEKLREHFDTDPECRTFAVALLRALTPDDFCAIEQLRDERPSSPTFGTLEDYDIYAVRLHSDFLAKYEVQGKTTWYVKLTMRADGDRPVFCVSMHRLERLERRRAGGWLSPEW